MREKTKPPTTKKRSTTKRNYNQNFLPHTYNDTTTDNNTNTIPTKKKLETTNIL